MSMRDASQAPFSIDSTNNFNLFRSLLVGGAFSTADEQCCVYAVRGELGKTLAGVVRPAHLLPVTSMRPIVCCSLAHGKRIITPAPCTF